MDDQREELSPTRRVNRRRVLLGIAGGAGALLLSACGAAAPTTVPPVRPRASEPAITPSPERAGRAVRFAWWTDVGSLTPFQVSTAGPGGVVLLSLLFDTLTWKDANGIIPWLASGWETSRDGRTYVFRVTDGATWHDGRPVTPQDVKFSFDYYAQHPFRWMSSEVVESTAVVSDRSVSVTLKRPYAAFLSDIVGVVPIIPQHVWAPVADPLKYTDPRGFIGSGPFKLVSHDEAQGAYSLSAHEGYWRGRPAVGEWQQIAVPAEARVEIVRSGAADVSLSTDASVEKLLAGDARLKVFETAPLSVVRLAVNTERAPLDRKEVRQAIAYALDRKRIAETVTKGPAILGSGGVIPPETPWYNPNVRQYGYSPEQARALLGGQSFTLDLIADAQAKEPDLMAPMLDAVGIRLNVKRVDAPTRAQLLKEGKFQLALTSHIGVGGDPDYLRRWYAGEEANAFAQGSVFHNAEFTRLGEEQAAALDASRRRAAVDQMQEILAEQLPTIALYYRRFYWVYDPGAFTPMNTWGGLMNGIPFPNNKLALLAR